MADAPKRIFYIIRWMKYQNPTYQMGEMVPTQGGRHVPSPAQVYSSLSIIFLHLKRHHGHEAMALLTLGMTEEEKLVVGRFVATQPRAELLRHMARPIGKKADGTPYRVYLVDGDFDVLKAIKQEITKEHFEIVGLARNADAALGFFLSNKSQIDLVFLGMAMGGADSSFILDKMLSSKVGLRVFGMAADKTRFASELVALLAGKELIPLPIQRDSLMRILAKGLQGG